MKKFLVVLVLLFSTMLANAQTLAYQADAFCSREYTYHGWSAWSSWRPCDILITIDITNDRVTILSERSQYYKIVTEGETYRTPNASVAEFGFIDQDGDRGIMRLVQKSSGASEIYIEFRNIAWGYDVNRL